MKAAGFDGYIGKPVNVMTLNPASLLARRAGKRAPQPLRLALSVRLGRPRSRTRVRHLLLWLVLTCLVPGLIGVGVLFERMYRDDRAQTAKDTIRTARAMALALDAGPGPRRWRWRSPLPAC